MSGVMGQESTHIPAQEKYTLREQVGITFEFTPGGFRTAGDQKQLHWLTEKLLYWRNHLEGVAAYCNQKNIMLELRLCAGPSLGEMAVREALHLQANAIILDRY
jgi:hypothetical protein